jgi:GWxTD domain-containing protein
MKRYFILVFLTVMMHSMFGQKLNAVVTYRSFCDEELKPYIEFGFLLEGTTLKYVKNENQKLQAAVRITVEVKTITPETLLQKIDYILLSEEKSDINDSIISNIYDVKTLGVPAGTYMLNFSMKDMNNDELSSKFSTTIELNFSDTIISASPIIFYKEITEISTPDPLLDRYGYNTVPVFENVFNETFNNIFYAIEIYNSKKILAPQKAMFVRSYIENTESRYVYFESLNTSKLMTDDFTFQIKKLDLSYLPTGNYYLVYELYSEDSTTFLYSTRKYFQRINPGVIPTAESYQNVLFIGTFVEKMTNLNEMRDNVACLFPIAKGAEKEFISHNLNTSSIDQLKRFFYGFWYLRAPLNPKLEWEKYAVKADLANKEFGSPLMKGYQTDRGRVYLQYGAPNAVMEEPFDSHSYPYEIWQYLELNGQANVKFIFYNRNLASNLYELLHSDAIGELQDPFWKLKLSTRNAPIYNTDERDLEDYYGSSAEDNYKFFK